MKFPSVSVIGTVAGSIRRTVGKSILSAAAVLFILSLPAPATASEPVAVWHLGTTDGHFIPELTGSGMDLIIQGEPELVDGIDGNALRFPGQPFYLVTDNHSPLRMRDAVTVDVWVKPESPGDGEMHCIVDKGGERYRVQISSGGNPFFGVKNQDDRGDLSAEFSLMTEWTRITGVFERPLMRLYVDGDLVAERVWDHEMDDGGSFFIGSKSGRNDFFTGVIDTVVIYDEAREPEEGDYEMIREQYTSEDLRSQATPVTDQFQVSELEEGAVEVKGEDWVVRFGKETIESIRVGEKDFLLGNHAPLLTGKTAQGEDRAIQADLNLESVDNTEEGVRARYQGTMIADDQRLPLTLDVKMVPGRPALQVLLDLDAEAAPELSVEQLAVQLPLNLNPRKRIAQGGEDGVSWDTRYFYQFHVAMGRHPLMPPFRMSDPDVNIWRYFRIDQLTPSSFTLWRSESEETSALVMQRGRQAEGWISMYDEEGGVILAKSDLSKLAPAGLAADADGGGLLKFHLHPPNAPPEAVGKIAANPNLKEHGLNVLFFLDPWSLAMARDRLSPIGYEVGLPWERRPREESLQRLEPQTVSPDQSFSPRITGGLPIGEGKLQPDQEVFLRAGSDWLALQSRPIGFWPDGSVKWLLLTFDPGETGPEPEEAGQTVPFEVTYRNRDAEPLELVLPKEPVERVEAEPVATERDNEIRIDAGPLRGVFTVGKEWLKELTLNGESLIPMGRTPEVRVDFFEPEEKNWFPEDYARLGTSHPGRWVVEELTVEENGPLRTVIFLKGDTEGEVPVGIQMRWEFHHQRPSIRVEQTVEFYDHDPRKYFVEEISFRFPWEHREQARLMSAWDGAAVAEVAEGDFALMQLDPFSVQIRREANGESSLTSEAGRAEGWLAAEGVRGAAFLGVRDFWRTFPSSLEWDADAGQLVAGFWPRRHPLMDVRRYSKYPHRSQGESVSGNNDWVWDRYYPNDPFAGTTRTQEFLLSFSSELGETERWQGLAADFERRPLVYAGAERYAETGVVLEYAQDGSHPLTTANLEVFTDFLLFHQDHWNWYGFWNYGDFQHHFRSGYGWILPPDELEKILAMTPEEREAEVASVPNQILDYEPQQDWASDNGRWGWTNTEGCPNLMLQNEYLRTGRRDYFFAAEALARHSRDVVMRHNGQWFGRGTRHGVQHWSDGNHEVRQTVQSETRIHYFLTGEPRTRAFALRLGNEVYTDHVAHGAAAHSGFLYGLLFCWELTGDSQWGEWLEKYLHLLCSPEGIAIGQRVEFPGPEAVGPARDLNGASMFFHTFGAMHALLEYQQITEDPVVHEALMAMAEALLPESLERTRNFRRTLKVFGYALRHTDEPEPFLEVMQEWLESEGYHDVYNTVAANPRHWTGETSFLRRNIPGSLFLMNSWPYLAGALSEEPVPSERARQSIEFANQNGLPRPARQLSWQSEYDRPEFEEYLGPWRPWTQHDQGPDEEEAE